MGVERSKLLVVDAEAGPRRDLGVALAQLGYAVDQADEGWPALELVASSVSAGQPYRAVIAAVDLPDIHGLKLLELIKSSYPTLPVIVVSATGNETTPDAVTRRHGDAYLPKPFTVDQLTAAVERIPKSEIKAAELPATDAQPTPASAYAMVRLRDGADRMALFGRLHALEQATCCDAVHGDYDVALLLNASDQAALGRLVDSEISSCPEVASVTLLPIVKPDLDPGLQGFFDHLRQPRCAGQTAGQGDRADALATYLLVSIEPGRFAEAFPRLSFMRGVVACDATSGEHDAVALIRTHSFEENKRILRDDIKRIDGIARARSMKVITILDI
ncbi:MAG: Lrp/AsnC ligand binding domain-containing protein [Deltaproteobacteria bacterium]|nr:Lrp/AsnC ligand binding domain-containing protein [Deltaproteobacteria bacterium]